MDFLSPLASLVALAVVLPLLAFALLVLTALAVNEFWCGRLPVPRTQS